MTIDDAIGTMRGYPCVCEFGSSPFTCQDSKCPFGEAVRTLVNEERPKGKWIIHNDYNENCRYGCDQCGNLTNRNSGFCPDCGARMER